MSREAEARKAVSREAEARKAVSREAEARKAQLRCLFRQKALALSPENSARVDTAIAAIVFSLQVYKSAKTIFCFVGRRGEIDTRPLLERIWQEGKRPCVPLCTEPGRMEARALPSWQALRPGRYGILEPDPRLCPLVEPGALDLILAPCLSATRQGARLGQGGGYYDRYRAGLDTPSLLLCREEMLSQSLPLQPWDLFFDAVVTEVGVWPPDAKIKSGKPGGA